MTNRRYLSSLTISSIIYAVGTFAVMWLWSATPPVKKVNEEVIKVAVITPPKPVVKPKPTPPTPPRPKIPEPPKVEPKPTPKPKPKKVIKKPEPKKVVKKVVPKPKPKPKPQPVMEQVVTQPVVNTEPKVVEVAPPPPPAPKVDLSAKKRIFLKKVRSSIYANKKYPPIAKRRNIQGRVKVTFDIDRGGQISNIQTHGGSKILQKSARKSVLQSAPFNIPSVLSGEFPMQNVSINIDFKLQ